MSGPNQRMAWGFIFYGIMCSFPLLGRLGLDREWTWYYSPLNATCNIKKNKGAGIADPVATPTRLCRSSRSRESSLDLHRGSMPPMRRAV